jgi:hypothetical protein
MTAEKRLQFIEAKDRLITASVLINHIKGSAAITDNELVTAKVEEAINLLFEANSILEAEEDKALKEMAKELEMSTNKQLGDFLEKLESN